MTETPYSIRRRLLMVLALGFTALIAGAGVYLFGVLEVHVTGEFDATLLAQARALAALTETEDGQIEFDYVPQHLPEYERAENPAYYQFWLDDGRSLLRSARLVSDLPRLHAPVGAPVIRDARLPDGRAGRLIELAFKPLPPDEDDEEDGDVSVATEDPDAAALDVDYIVVTVARSRGRLDSLLGNIQWGIFGVSVLAVALAILLVWRALAMGFRPIHGIAAQVEAMDAEHLEARVALERPPEELAPIVGQLNGLLERLDQSFHRERRFTGNVAHELRTPLAELRSLAAVGAKWPDDRASVVEYFEDVGAIAGRMEGVIATLLMLARCQGGVERLVQSRVDLREALEAAWHPHADDARRRGLSLALDVAPGFEVHTDGGKLGILLGNVLGNAVGHAVGDSQIRCQASLSAGQFTLQIENLAAQPLSEADLGCVTEPFWRKDPARSGEEHTGLGLALVAALADLMGFAVHFAQDPDGTFRVSVSGAAPKPAGHAKPSRSVS